MTKEAEVLKYVNGKIADLEDDLQHYTMVDKDKCKEFYIREDLKQFETLKQVLTELKEIKEAKPSEALKGVDILYANALDLTTELTKYLPEYLKPIRDKIKKALLKAQEQENENEILKEIIKSFFEKGSPLHQYIDEDGALTIEVDDECSIMRLGEFKGVELDKKLEEVLKNGKRI